MTGIGSTPDPDLRRRFSAAGLRLRVAGLCVNVSTDVPEVIDSFLEMYVGHGVETETGVDDCRVHLSYTTAVRRFVRRKTEVSINGKVVFAPSPVRLAYLSIEAALNWCIHGNAPFYVVLHAAVVERGGVAVMLPAAPGSGKSTLCAALVTRGWRLLSDELGVIRPAEFRLQPVARPISLKNDAVALIRAWAPGSHFSPLLTGTIRGDIAYLRPPAESVARADEVAEPTLIVSPAYQAGASATVLGLSKIETFRLLLDNGLNYHTTQRAGFETLARLVDTCPAYRLSYGTLAQAVQAIDELCKHAPPGNDTIRQTSAAA